MSGRFAVDTNAVVDYLRESRPVQPALVTASEILPPLTVLGELFASRATVDAGRNIRGESLLIDHSLLNVNLTGE